MLPPLTATSLRKFAPVTACPDCPFTWPRWEAVTKPLFVASPTRTRNRIATSPTLPSFTFVSVMLAVCALATAARLIVTTAPLVACLAVANPLLLTTVTPPIVTGSANVTTT